MAREKQQLGLRALDSAMRRAQQSQSGADEISFFGFIAEAMWWLTMLDEALWKTYIGGVTYESARASHVGDLLTGLRYARNRQVHDTRVTGMHGNPLLAEGEAGSCQWRWRPLNANGVPPFKPRGRRGRDGEQAYQDLMADREILPTLEQAAGFLNTWIEQLPIGPTRMESAGGA